MDKVLPYLVGLGGAEHDVAFRVQSHVPSFPQLTRQAERPSQQARFTHPQVRPDVQYYPETERSRRPPPSLPVAFQG